MFCSGCGHALADGQPVCPQCGRAAAPLAPPIPGFEYQLSGYSSKVRILGILWLAYAGLSLIFGFAGLSFAKEFFAGGFGPWMHGPWAHGNMPPFFGPAWIHLAWLSICVRAAFCAVAAWGLFEHTQWGRILAIIAAILALIHVPFGTALGIATLVILLGYRNSALYEQL